jgi:hypothetical protein
MGIVERARRILLMPKTEWQVIQTEKTQVREMLISYVLPLSLIPAVVSLLSALFWTNFTYGLLAAVIAVISAAVSFFIATYITDALAPSFSSDKDLDRSAQLVGYSYTASAVASILMLIPFLGILIVFIGFVYSVYLMYLGIVPMKNTPEDKRVAYVLVVLLVQVVLYYLFTTLLTSALLTSYLI